MVNCVAIAIIILYTVIVLTKLCIVELSHTLIHIYECLHYYHHTIDILPVVYGAHDSYS